MVCVYPVVLKAIEEGYLVSVPDLEIDTFGKDIAEAIVMARDAIGIWGICRQDESKGIPEPSELRAIACDANDTLTLVDIDFDKYRKESDNRSVRKNVTIPYWLNAQAEAAGLSFSGVLQNALKQELKIPSRF